MRGIVAPITLPLLHQLERARYESESHQVDTSAHSDKQGRKAAASKLSDTWVWGGAIRRSAFQALAGAVRTLVNTVSRGTKPSPVLVSATLGAAADCLADPDAGKETELLTSMAPLFAAVGNGEG